MKRTIIATILIILCSLPFTSCLKDDALLYSEMFICTMQENGSLLTDNNLRLDIVEDKVGGLETGSGRVLVLCDVLRNTSTDTYDIRLLAWSHVLSKEAVAASASEPEELGNDCINLMQAWSDGGGWVNTRLEVTAVNGSQKTHLINLVYDDSRANADTLFFRLRHNAYGESYDNPDQEAEIVTSGAYVSFNIEKFLPAGTDNLILHFDWDWFSYDNGNYFREKIPYSGNLNYKR